MTRWGVPLTLVAIHQPNFLPYLGFFQKMALCDVFVLYDTAQFSRREYHNRNRIKSPAGVRWVTVPVRNAPARPIRDVAIDDGQAWRRKVWNALRVSYGRSPGYERFAPRLKELLESPGSGSLADLNVALIRFLRDALGLRTPLTLASELAATTSEDASARLVELTRLAGGDAYLSGAGALEYLDPAGFTDVPLHVVRFVPHPYPQLWGPFVPNLSAVDALFNGGPAAAGWISGETDEGAAVPAVRATQEA